MTHANQNAPDNSAPVPVHGEVTHRIRTVKRGITRANIVTAFAIASVVAGVVLWATSELSRKADARALDAVVDRVNALEPRVAGFDRDLVWIRADTSWLKQALWQMAQRSGVPVVPPPTAPLTPLAPPVAP